VDYLAKFPRDEFTSGIKSIEWKPQPESKGAN